MKLTKNKKYLQQKFSQKVLALQTTADFKTRVSKSYVPFTCKFPMVMHFVSILHRYCRSKTNFYVFSYDKTSLKFCASFRFFLAVFMEKFQKIRYLNYVRRGISSCTMYLLTSRVWWLQKSENCQHPCTQGIWLLIDRSPCHSIILLILSCESWFSTPRGDPKCLRRE